MNEFRLLAVFLFPKIVFHLMSPSRFYFEGFIVCTLGWLRCVLRQNPAKRTANDASQVWEAATKTPFNDNGLITRHVDRILINNRRQGVKAGKKAKGVDI